MVDKWSVKIHITTFNLKRRTENYSLASLRIRVIETTVLTVLLKRLRSPCSNNQIVNRQMDRPKFILK